MIENKQITEAGVYVLGHIHEIVIRLYFDCGCIEINPGRNWFADDGSMPFYDLFDCFDIDCEDRARVEDLKGKYCRIEYDENFKIKRIWHIVKDRYVDIDNLK